MDKFSLKQLRYFDAVVQYKHFGRAADICAISQPALSMQIKLLEEMLGKKLFERTAKEAYLTAFGESFAHEAKAILMAVDKVDLWITKQQAQNMLRLRMGIIPTMAPYILPQLIGKIRSKYEGLELQLRETMTVPLLEALIEGRLDAAILALPISDPRFEEVECFKEEFVLVRPAVQIDMPLPKRDQLKEMRWLLLEEGHCFRDQALAVCNLDTNKPREVLDGSSLSTLVQMVGAGMGVTLLPKMAVRLESQKANISITRFDEPRPVRSVGMVWRKESALASELYEIAHLLKSLKQG